MKLPVGNKRETPAFRPIRATELHASPVEFAPRLLGGLLTRGQVSLRISEVEAYDGITDPGSHAFGGVSARCQTMALAPGLLYVYFTYGMHHAVNIVCHKDGEVGGILLRAGEIVAGRDIAARRRHALRAKRAQGGGKPLADDQLARGPGNLAVALAFTRADDRRSLFADAPAASAIRLYLPTGAPDAAQIGQSGRVGVSGDGGDAMRYPWRWYLRGDRTVSAYRRGKAG